MSIERRLAAIEGRRTARALARLRRAVADAKAEFDRHAPAPEAAEAALARLEAARPPDTPDMREIEVAVRTTRDERATEVELCAALACLFPAGTPAHVRFAEMAEVIEALTAAMRREGDPVAFCERLHGYGPARIAALLEGA